jgi:hypothetical protein
MITVQAMTMAVVQVIDMISMDDCLVAAAVAVNMIVVVMYLVFSHKTYGAPVWRGWQGPKQHQ